MPGSDRLTRVNEVLKREIADLLERDYFIKDASALVSITGVRTAPNLRNAIVSVSIMGDDKARREAFELLRKHRAAIQHQLSKDVVLKYTPVLDFQIDDTIEKGDHVLELIREMEQDADHKTR